MAKWEWLLLGLAAIAVIVAIKSYGTTIVPPAQAITLPDGVTKKSAFSLGVTPMGDGTVINAGIKL
jgi:hypothetical protein